MEYKQLTSLLVIASAALGLAACATPYADKMSSKPTGDGDVTVPSDYRSWVKFVPTVDKANGQVREIYINDAGLKAQRGGAFPAGTVTVMEIYKARKDGSDNLVRTGDGRLIKDELSKVFVMAKGVGWGNRLPDGVVRNGDWLYGAYLADARTPATKDFTACRGCHAPLADKDFVARYDEHFDQR